MAPTEFAADTSRLLQPEHLATRTEVLQRPCPVPAAAGVYAWYFRDPPPAIPLDGCHEIDGAYLLYVGISPGRPPVNGKPPSSENLRKRIRYHYTGNAYGSTLRLSVGCLLAAELGTPLVRVSDSGRMTFAAGEQSLNAWMSEHAFVTWTENPEPWTLEHELIQCLNLPLNLDGNRTHAFHASLTEARRQARAQARSLPMHQMPQAAL